jgi:hypothetical protein
MDDLAQSGTTTSICNKTSRSFCRLELIDSTLMASRNSAKVEYFVSFPKLCYSGLVFRSPCEEVGYFPTVQRWKERTAFGVQMLGCLLFVPIHSPSSPLLSSFSPLQPLQPQRISRILFLTPKLFISTISATFLFRLILFRVPCHSVSSPSYQAPHWIESFL